MSDLPRLFEPFFTTKTGDGGESGPKGTGLGLYMVRQLLEPYSGTIGVESSVGEGTTFRVVVPLQAPAPVVEEEIVLPPEDGEAVDAAPALAPTAATGSGRPAGG